MEIFAKSTHVIVSFLQYLLLEWKILKYNQSMVNFWTGFHASKQH